MNLYIFEHVVGLPDDYERNDGLIVIAESLEAAVKLARDCKIVLKKDEISRVESFRLFGTGIKPRVLAFADLEGWWKWND